MRVQLEVNNRSVELEDSGHYGTVRETEVFFDLLKSALLSVGYTELEILVHLSGAAKEMQRENK